MKIKDRLKISSLKIQILVYFICFGIVLLLLLWLIQGVFFEKYYQESMKRKCKASIDAIAAEYSISNLNYNRFTDFLEDVAFENGITVFIKSIDGSIEISTNDLNKPNIRLPNGKALFSEVVTMLENSSDKSLSIVMPSINNESIIVCAKYVTCEERPNIYVFAASMLNPMGPSVDIMKSQLVVVTVAVFLFGVIVAIFAARHLSKPIADMNKEAKKLGDGDFDVEFKASEYEELSSLASTLNDAAKKLKTSDSLQRDLLANVSHDIRTPLTMIKSYAEMVRDLSGDNKEKREEHLNVIIEETDRLSNLVNDILILSKVQSGTEIFKNERFDLVEACDDIVNTYMVVQSEGFEISYIRPDKAIFVLGDENRIKQVISNLLGNAIKYSDKIKKIDIVFEESDTDIKLLVLDKGIGIEEDNLSLIWNRYQRASQRGNRSKDGTGLGLSICSEILKRHNAKYGVESKINEGSCFWFELKKDNC